MLCQQIYPVTREDVFCRDYALTNQMRRSAISIISNIAEGFERSGTREFNQFLAIAKGSTGELMSQLYIALDQNYISITKFNELYNLTSEISKLTGGLIKYLKTSNIKGQKYKQ